VLEDDDDVDPLAVVELVDPLAVVELVDVRIDDFGVLRRSSFPLRELWGAEGEVLYGGMFLDSSR